MGSFVEELAIISVVKWVFVAYGSLEVVGASCSFSRHGDYAFVGFCALDESPQIDWIHLDQLFRILSPGEAVVDILLD